MTGSQWLGFFIFASLFGTGTWFLITLEGIKGAAFILGGSFLVVAISTFAAGLLSGEIRL